jgi:hypothetical protein
VFKHRRNKASSSSLSPLRSRFAPSPFEDR